MDSKRLIFAAAVALLIFSNIYGMLISNPMDPAIAIILSTLRLLIPVVVCLGWYFFWSDTMSPLRFLAYWNAVTQIAFQTLFLLQVTFTNWGIVGWTYIGTTISIILLTLTRASKNHLLFSLTGLLIILNVTLPFVFLLLSYDFSSLTGANERDAWGPLSFFTLEAGSIGILLTAASQLYWHEITKKKRDDEIMERIFELLEKKGLKKE